MTDQVHETFGDDRLVVAVAVRTADEGVDRQDIAKTKLLLWPAGFDTPGVGRLGHFRLAPSSSIRAGDTNRFDDSCLELRAAPVFDDFDDGWAHSLALEAQLDFERSGFSGREVELDLE